MESESVFESLLREFQQGLAKYGSGDFFIGILHKQEIPKELFESKQLKSTGGRVIHCIESGLYLVGKADNGICEETMETFLQLARKAGSFLTSKFLNREKIPLTLNPGTAWLVYVFGQCKGTDFVRPCSGYEALMKPFQASIYTLEALSDDSKMGDKRIKTKRGRPPKYKEEDMKKLGEIFERYLKKTTGHKTQSWECAARQLTDEGCPIPSGIAAKAAYQRYITEKQNIKQN